MTKEVRHENKTIDEAGRDSIAGENNICPKCGGEMIATGQGVAASFPSPALERLTCSSADCSYVRYVKLDLNGFATEGKLSTGKGEQSA